MRCQNCGRLLEANEKKICSRCRKIIEQKPCLACKGTGKLLGRGRAICPTCQGKKTLP